MEELSNNDLIVSWNDFIQKGDLDALSKVYFHHYDLLFSYGLKHSSDTYFVEDIIQDVFMNLIKQRKRISEVKNIAGYLVTTFRNQLFLDLNKQKNIILTEFPEEQFEFYKSPDQLNTEKENLEQVHLAIKQCVSKLTSKQQEIIYLRFNSGISYEEISEMLQISVDSCYKSVHRSIRKIRTEAEKILSKKEIMILWFWSKMSSKRKSK